MKKFKDEVSEFVSKFDSDTKKAVMSAQNLADDSAFNNWASTVVRGSRLFTSLFSVELIIRFKDNVLFDFVLPKQN